jgi:hypothetical protein
MPLTQCGWVTATKATRQTLQGTKGTAGLSPEVLGPRGRYLTGLVEPCGALPRKCYYYYHPISVYAPSAAFRPRDIKLAAKVVRHAFRTPPRGSGVQIVEAGLS